MTSPGLLCRLGVKGSHLKAKSGGYLGFRADDVASVPVAFDLDVNLEGLANDLGSDDLGGRPLGHNSAIFEN